MYQPKSQVTKNVHNKLNFQDFYIYYNFNSAGYNIIIGIIIHLGTYLMYIRSGLIAISHEKYNRIICVLHN